MSYPKLVYLAGPIAGMSYDEARFGWREEFARMMPDYIECVSPMRGKDMLEGVKALGVHPGHPMTEAAGILGRDFYDVQRCDAMVACFLGVEKVSIGTCVEFGWASALRKPTIIVLEKEGNAHDHIFLTHNAVYRVDDLKEAAFLITYLLSPGV